MEAVSVSSEVHYLLVVVGLFIVPRALQRLRIPSAVTCLALGALLGLGFHLFHDDAAIPLLATLGIVALFLFAGLEVDIDELRKHGKVMLGHLALQLVQLVIAAYVVRRIFALEWRSAILLVLALFTPSTGFILDSLTAFGLTPKQAFWVKTKAIASELVALGALFVTVQSGSAELLFTSSFAMVMMVALLPTAFRMFANLILPFAPKSEFTFLLILALICAYLTRELGVYYLVGAFVVGVTAVRLRKQLPVLASDRLMIGIDLFASFFIPFYFFKAGLHLRAEFFNWTALLLGVSFVAAVIPLRVALTALFRWWVMKEPLREGARVGLCMSPTLVFTIVLADILQERYALPDELYGALLVFTLVNTAVPGFILRATPPDFVAPHSVPPPPEEGEMAPLPSDPKLPQVASTDH